MRRCFGGHVAVIAVTSCGKAILYPHILQHLITSCILFWSWSPFVSSLKHFLQCLFQLKPWSGAAAAKKEGEEKWNGDLFMKRRSLDSTTIIPWVSTCKRSFYPGGFPRYIYIYIYVYLYVKLFFCHIWTGWRSVYTSSTMRVTWLGIDPHHG